jgi:hypothetical protein
MTKLNPFPVLFLVQPTGNPEELVDVEKIRVIVKQSSGILTFEDQSIAWMVLCGLFPKRIIDWNETCKQFIRLYRRYVEEFKISD